MARFTIFAIFVVLQLGPGALVQGTVTEVLANAGNSVRFEMRDPTLVQRCDVTSAAGVNFTLYPTLDGPSNVQHSGLFAFRTCTMSLSSTSSEDAGVWIIRAYSDEVGTVTTASFLLRLHETAPIVPSSSLRIISGSYLAMRFVEEYNNLKSCNVTNPQGEVINVLDREVHHEGIELFGQCGFRLMANASHHGNWRIRAETDRPILHSNSVNVQVQDENLVDDSSHTEMRIELGSSEVILLGPSDASFCQLQRPDGVHLPLQFGRCRFEIPVATSLHNGTWIAHSGVDGMMNVVESRTTVIIYENRSLNTTVTSAENNRINLLCRFRARTFSFCRFVRPDGLSMHVSMGLGNERYVYYGNGTRSSMMFQSQEHDCGLTILHPLDEDYGAWRCIAGVDRDIIGAILQVGSSKNSTDIQTEKIHSTGGTVYVKSGDSFTIKCNVDATLSYCWLRSPNGTHYSVSTTGNAASHLRYTGSGLSLGECGAIVKNADNTHSGDWRCNMGVTDGPEVKAIVSVIVSESQLISSRNVQMNTGRVYLGCRTLPESDYRINYCRWIRPDGHGIHVSMDNRYVVYHNTTACEILIQNVRPEEDIGRWTCAAGLVGESEEEVRMQIDFMDEALIPKAATSAIFGCGAAFLMVAIFVFSAVMFRMILQRRKTSPNNPEIAKWSLEPTEVKTAVADIPAFKN